MEREGEVVREEEEEPAQRGVGFVQGGQVGLRREEEGRKWA